MTTELQAAAVEITANNTQHSKAFDALIAFIENDLERQQSMLRYAKSVVAKAQQPKIHDFRIAEKEKEIAKTIALLKLARGED